MSRRSSQLYREQGRYLERVWKWVEKVGLETIRAAIMDDHDGRRALFERFVKSQRAAQKDPWAERAAGRERTNSRRSPIHRACADGRRMSDPSTDSGSMSARCTHSRCAARAPCGRRAARSRCSAPPSDEVFALENRCPHKGGPLSEGIVHGRKVACPLHNWIINLEDGEATGADKGCARSFPVKLENGRIYLDMSVAAAP